MLVSIGLILSVIMIGGDDVAISDARKRANTKWDKANTKIASCKMRTDEYNKFKKYAEDHGKTISGMLLDYVRSCIKDTV